MRQKFYQLQIVKTDTDIEAIVKGTYSQIYGGDDIKNYSLYVLKDGKISDNVSWFSERQLSLNGEYDPIKAQDMIEEYELKGRL